MTREEAKKLLPIIQAYIEGKIIQRLISDTWKDVDDTNIKLHLTASPSHYRIKPEPRYRPFKTHGECWNEMHKHPNFGWVRDKEEGALLLITAISDKFVYFDGDATKIDKAYDIYEFLDSTPFGVKEE